MERRSFVSFQRYKIWVVALPIALLLFVLLLGLLRPDPAASHFARAQRLQTAGQWQQALKLYEIIVETRPQSTYAPLALQQEGEILSARGRRNGDAKLLRQAIAAYLKISQTYSTHSLAGESLLAAGSLALNDLHDLKSAGEYYSALIKNYSNNPDYVSEATLRLGRIALQEGDGKVARDSFERVLKKYSRYPERSAEAQYQLGIVYETLLQNKSAARMAYERTIKKYEQTIWAADAKERLGMLLYSGGGQIRPARRVLIALPPLPNWSNSDSAVSALRLLLAARGVEVSDALWRGWSLSPFVAGYSQDKPAKTPSTPPELETVTANAGLTLSRNKEASAAAALNTLRDELDIGHVPMISMHGWALVVGYDSARDEVLLRRPGGKAETIANKPFLQQWKKSANFACLIFSVPGEKLTPTSQESSSSESDSVDNQPAPSLAAPQFVFKLPKLSQQEITRRALKRAVTLLARDRDDQFLLNGQALEALSNELGRLAKLPPSPIPRPEAENKADEILSTPASEDAIPTVTPTPKPAPIETASTRAIKAKAQQWSKLHVWFGTPLKAWIVRRRDAVQFLKSASGLLKNSSLQNAADSMQNSVDALEAVQSSIPGADALNKSPDATRREILAIKEQIDAAVQAERGALDAMKS